MLAIHKIISFALSKLHNIMKTIIKRKLSFSNNDNLILICNKKNKLSKFKLQDNELKFINKQWQKNEEIIYINQYNRCLFIVNPNFIKEKNKHIESLRLIGFKLQSQISSFNGCDGRSYSSNFKSAASFQWSSRRGNVG